MKKYLFYFLFIVGAVQGFAQSSEGLVRNVLVTVPMNEEVSYGEFQVELQKTWDFKGNQEGYWFSYLYATHNKFNHNQIIYCNDKPLYVNRDIRLRMYRVSPTMDGTIFVLKSMEQAAKDIGYRMEAVSAYGITYPVCDTVVHIDDDGFISYINDKYQYTKYRSSVEEKVMAVPVVWPERKVYDGNDLGMPAERKALFSHLEKGAVYYDGSEGHYYFLHRDRFMPNTVLVVDNNPVELFDVYTYDNFRLKYSHNGKHWMAVGNECYWVDGMMRSVEGYEISDFVVNNDGHFAYMASPKDSDKRKAVVVADGQILRRNAQVCYFGLNEEGKLKFRFLSGGRILQYENGEVADVSSSLVNVSYPNSPFFDRPVVVQSKDGTHKMTYQKDIPGVVIDGERVSESIPCYAIYDEWNSAFIWSAIEESGDKVDLVIYRYVIANNFFKKMFK